MNTLACALHLSAKGLRVGVFEGASEPGGAVKTGEYTAPGFRHDWAAMNLSLFAGSPFFKEYGAELGKHGCAFVPVNRPFASSFADGSWVRVSTDMGETLEAIRRLSPQDAATWERLVGGFGAEAPHLFGLLGAKMNFRAFAYFIFKTLRAKGVAGSLDFARFLTLSSLPDWRAEALKRFAYVHIAPSLDQMAATYAQALAGQLPAEPILVVGQPTVFDPSRAPEGAATLWVQVRMAPGVITGDAKGEITARDWAQATDPFAARALEILEAHAPGTRAKIIGQRIVSPLELESDNPNLVGGDQICGSHHLSQNFLFRPARGHADGSPPLPGLHLTGAAVWPGAGTGAGAGYLLAQKLAG